MAQHGPASMTVRETLACALGLPNYHNDATAVPYINYIANQYKHRDNSESYLKLFIFVVEFFEKGKVDEAGRRYPATIRELMDHLIAQDCDDMFEDAAGSPSRIAMVEDTVLCIIGVWTMMLSSFSKLPNGLRKICAAYNTQIQKPPGDTSQYCEETVATLIKRSGLIPASARWAETMDTDPSGNTADQGTSEIKSNVNSSLMDDSDYFESLSIGATRLNACRLSILGGVDIVWTCNVSRHMVLSERSEKQVLAAGGRHVLELFALPCAFSYDQQISDGMVITPGLKQEIYDSYGSLFNAWSEPLHVRYGGSLGIRRFCWCWPCSAYRYRHRTLELHKVLSGKSTDRKTQRVSPRIEFDPMLIDLINPSGQPTDWSHDIFPSLWPRIIILENHLRTAKPKSIWVLLRDRRDTLQYYTFLFAAVIVGLTIVQVLLGIAQVVGSFQT